MDTTIIVVILAVAALLAVKIFVMSKQNKELLQRMGQLHQDIDQKLFQHSDQFERKFQATTTNLFTITKNLSDLRTSQRHIEDLRSELTSLNAILHTPKLRGNLGELLLSDLLSNYFPKSRFGMQHTFRAGHTVDAVLFLEDNFKLCIDAKFPLENYRKYIENPSEETYLSQFKRDVKKHISDISKKYILPQEKTLGFALMYIPSETIYYELISHKDLSEILPFGYDQNVLPVSPSTLYSYIQILLLGFKGLQIEEHAEKILLATEQLATHIGKFTDQYEKVGKHLTNASNAFEDSKRRLERVQIISENMQELEQDDKETGTTEKLENTSDEAEFTLREIPIES